MMYAKAFAVALFAVVILTLLAARFAQAIGFEDPGLDAIFRRMIGFGFMGAALLLRLPFLVGGAVFGWCLFPTDKASAPRGG